MTILMGVDGLLGTPKTNSSLGSRSAYSRVPSLCRCLMSFDLTKSTNSFLLLNFLKEASLLMRS